MAIRSSRYRLPYSRALLAAALLATTAGCARARPTGAVLGSSEVLAPALEHLSSTGATITVSSPAYVALVELGPDRPRLVFPGAEGAPGRMNGGRHRIRFAEGTRLAFGPPAPSTVRLTKVCLDERGERSTGVGAEACTHRPVGTPAQGRNGFRHLLVFASEAPLTAAQLRGALQRVGEADDPESQTRALAAALLGAGSDGRWAAYLTDPY